MTSTEVEPGAVKVDTTDLDSLRKMCMLREIPYHHNHKEAALLKIIEEYDASNAPPDDGAAPADFTPAPRAVPAQPPRAETFTRVKAEVPGDIAEALKELSGYSIGRVNTISRYIETLL